MSRATGKRGQPRGFSPRAKTPQPARRPCDWQLLEPRILLSGSNLLTNPTFNAFVHNTSTPISFQNGDYTIALGNGLNIYDDGFQTTLGSATQVDVPGWSSSGNNGGQAGEVIDAAYISNYTIDVIEVRHPAAAGSSVQPDDTFSGSSGMISQSVGALQPDTTYTFSVTLAAGQDHATDAQLSSLPVQLSLVQQDVIQPTTSSSPTISSDGSAVTWTNTYSFGSSAPSSATVEIQAGPDSSANEEQTDILNASFTATPNSTHLAFVEQPTSTTTGGSLGTFAVEALAANGDIVASDSSSATLFLTNANGATLSGTKTVQFNAGIATFTALSVSSPGNYTLTAGDGSLTAATSSPFTVSAPAPVASKLAFVQQPAGTAINSNLGNVVVDVESSAGTLVTSDNSTVTVTLSNANGATLGGTATAQASGGVATFSTLSVSAPGTGYQLTASDGTLTPATSSPFNISDVPTQLAFSQQPANGAPGTLGAVTVDVEDAGGNLDTGDSSTVTLALSSSTNATLGGTVTAQASGGIATFSNLAISTAGNGYTLTATDGTLTPATSNSFNILAPGTTGTIAGNVADQTTGQGDPGVLVYVDLNNDDTFDFGDPSAITDSSGNYTIPNVSAGTYSIRQVVPPNSVQTLPASFADTATVTAGQTLTFNFAQRLLGNTAAFNFDFIAAQAVQQPDGKLVVVGHTDPSAGTEESVVARYYPDGVLDTSFGQNGEIKTAVGNTNSQANDVIVENDGDVIVVGDYSLGSDSIGNTTSLGYYQRYTPEGQPDSTFQLLDTANHFGSYGADTFSQIALGSNGKILITAQAFGSAMPYYENGLVIELDDNGSLDSSYGPSGAGYNFFALPGYEYNEPTLVSGPAPGDGIYLVASGLLGNGDNAGLGELSANGILSSSLDFGASAFGTAAALTALDVAANGDIVVAGYNYGGEASIVAELNPDGNFDSNFGQDGSGSVSTDFGGTDQTASDVQVEPDGEILVTGTSSGKVVSAMYTPTGTLETTTTFSTSTGGVPSIAKVIPNFGVSTASPGLLIVHPFFGGYGGAYYQQPPIITPTGVVHPQATDPAPTGSLNAPTGPSAAGAPPYQFTVQYTDSPGTILRSSIGGGSLLVTGSNGFSANADFLGLSSTGQPNSVIAHYEVIPPGGSWQTTDDGTYTVTLNANQVENTQQVSLSQPATLGSFQVTVGGPVIPDNGLLQPTVFGSLPPAVIAGKPAKIRQTITLTNTGASAYAATQTTKLFLSTTNTLTSAAIPLAAQLTRFVKLKVGKHISFKLGVKSLPSSVPSGTYFLLAQTIDNNGNSDIAASTGSISVQPARIDLAVSLGAFTSSAAAGGKFKETIIVSNATSNVPATGFLPIVVDTSPLDGNLSDATVLAQTSKKINLKPGSSKSIVLPLVAPATPSSDFLIFQIDPNNTFGDVSLANNMVVSPVKVTFS